MRGELSSPARTLPERLDAAADRPPVWETLVAHRRWQRLLACMLTGNLDPAGASALRAHARDCSACRSDLAELAPVAAMLPLADPDELDTGAHAPDALYRKVVSGIRGDQVRRRRARWQRRLLVAAAVLALAAALAAALLLLPSELVAGPAHAEPVRLQAVTAGVNVLSAQLVTHAWGGRAGLPRDRADRRRDLPGELRDPRWRRGRSRRGAGRLAAAGAGQRQRRAPPRAGHAGPGDHRHGPAGAPRRPGRQRDAGPRLSRLPRPRLSPSLRRP